MKNSLFIIFIFLNVNLFSADCQFCTAVEKENFKSVENIFRTKLLERKKGNQVNNGSTTYTTYNKVYDDLVLWLQQKECVELAAWDKCQEKILPYPSYATIGVILKTPNRSVEMIFHVREGHSNRLKQRYSKRERLYYLGMTEDSGFVRNQISLCQLEEKPSEVTNPILITDTLEQNNDMPFAAQKFNDTIDYKHLLGQYFCIGCQDTIVFEEFGHPATSVMMKRTDIEVYSFPLFAEGKMKQIGVYSPWRIQIVGIRVLPNGDLEAYFSGSYLFEYEFTTKQTYRKIITD
ncbi:MAG: hypothetical protein R3279_10300 [Putridiphycobacter sp.]|nr:hypothetical protein [Putridiphycobacter sp.]